MEKSMVMENVYTKIRQDTLVIEETTNTLDTGKYSIKISRGTRAIGRMENMMGLASTHLRTICSSEENLIGEFELMREIFSTQMAKCLTIGKTEEKKKAKNTSISLNGKMHTTSL